MKFKDYQIAATEEADIFSPKRTRSELSDALKIVIRDWEEERDKLRALLRRWAQTVGEPVFNAFDLEDIQDTDFVDRESDSLETDVESVLQDTDQELEEK